MLKNLVKPLSKSLFPTYNLLTKSTMQISTAQAAQKLSQLLEGQIEAEQGQKEDLRDYRNFFENQGWKLDFYSTRMELSKKNGPFNLRILAQAKAPRFNSEEEGNQQREDAEGEDFQFISAFIGREGSNNWLNASFLFSKGYTHLANIRFIDDYEKVKKQVNRQKVDEKYQGPDPASLDEKITQNLFQFINELGIEAEVIERVGELSIAYEQELYVDWLKDVRSIL